MRLKSFHGATLTEAMRAVREALGENAIIVATREDETGGVRVTAAIDEVPVSSPAATRQSLPVEDSSESLEIIAEALTRHHVPTNLAEKLMATSTQFANDDALLALSAAIDMHFKFTPVNEDKPLMLVGPPGAGKTLCIAKFATKSIMTKKTPTVISTDLERAGGMEQLAAFTRLLKLNLVEIEDWHSLRDIISMQKGNPIFIDTAGRNPFDAAEREISREYISAVGDAALVLPAGLDAVEAIELAHEFKHLGASRLIITRIDSMRRMGSLLRLAHDARLPLANFSASHKVTEALAPLNPVILARMILKKPGEKNAAEQPAEKSKSVYGGAQ